MGQLPFFFFGSFHHDVVVVVALSGNVIRDFPRTLCRANEFGKHWDDLLENSVGFHLPNNGLRNPSFGREFWHPYASFRAVFHIQQVSFK